VSVTAAPLLPGYATLGPFGSGETGRRQGDPACSLRGMPMSIDVKVDFPEAARPWIPSWDPGRGDSLIASALTEQSDLSAVDRFAQFHEHANEPLQGRYYSSLIPASPPGPGQQLAFEVDLDHCSGCKACVAACHSLNGLDDGEAWRDVGLLVGGTGALPVLQHVTSACHHCLDPACLSACPVNAYEKDPITGIVKHFDDQCFGCQYCTLACPYDVPKFHAAKGIVRKCDMCSDRLQTGEAPACVQACPHEAIRIRVVDVEEVAGRTGAGEFLPGTFDPSFTNPTTRYHSLRPGDLRPADEYHVVPEHAHTPLIVMLVLTQLAVGAFLVEWVFRLSSFDVPSSATLALGLGLGYLGLAASLLHLGRPHLAYRAFLGLRHSWLSREIIAFGLFAKLATAFVAAEWLFPRLLASHPWMRILALSTVVLAGVCGVSCSVMVYHVVRRPFWRASSSGLKFAGTTLSLGLAAALVGVAASEPAAPLVVMIAVALMAATAAKLWFESRERIEGEGDGPLRRTAWLLRGPLKRPVGLRNFLGVAGGVALPALAMVGSSSGDRGAVMAAAVLSLAAATASEIIERSLFFRAVTRSKMPGGLPS
jgi:formate dehydrogenase iron-sulfur subunit